MEHFESKMGIIPLGAMSEPKMGSPNRDRPENRSHPPFRTPRNVHVRTDWHVDQTISVRSIVLEPDSLRGQDGMPHYIGILMPQRPAGWRVYLPDFPGCYADNNVLRLAIAMARHTARSQIEQIHPDGMMPIPHTLQTLMAEDAWATARNIAWRQAIICLVPFPDSHGVTNERAKFSGILPPRYAAA
jgi:hypothetical protein